MPRRIAKSGDHRYRHFIKEWRKFRTLNQEQLAERIGTTKASISRIERGEQPYTQDFLEAAAEALMTTPGSLVMRDPNIDEALWTIWETAKPGQREQMLQLMRVVITGDRTGTNH